MAGRLVGGLFARILCGAVFALVKWSPRVGLETVNQSGRGVICDCRTLSIQALSLARVVGFCRCPVGLALDDVTSA